MATAILKVAPKGHVVQLSDPPTPEQRLHLVAARIDRGPSSSWHPRPAGTTNGRARTMRSRARKPPPSLQEVGAEIVRRVGEANAANGGGYVVRLSNPPTPSERFELLAARLERRPIVIMPHKCTMDEWMARYAICSRQ